VEVDTIAAVSTAAGRGAVAIVRISGPGALQILARVAPDAASPPPLRRAELVRIVDPSSGAEVDQALVTYFKAPDSYTAEDTVEISGHGGWLAPALVLEACVAAGARHAEPGEFTRRAYLNGKLDLVQAEAVLDLIEGRSRALYDAALHQLERGVSVRVAELRDRMIHLEVVLAHHIDFPEEDDPPVPRERILEEAREVKGMLAALLATSAEGELLREGALTVLAGRPNAGKSSLFNALIGEERAIVTEIPGTTRDALEAVVSVGGFPFRLVDTAGLREGGEWVEQLGIQVARRYLGRADLVLFCVEASREMGEEETAFLGELGDRPIVIMRTKADLSPNGTGPAIKLSEAVSPAGGGDRSDADRPSLRVSVETGEGLSDLKELLPSLVYSGLAKEPGVSPVLTRARQTAAARLALNEITAFEEALAGGVPAELAATHLRPAETALEELLGVISTEDVLDRLFREFCIGK
jgi:tRNA modification GTPase